MCGIAGYFAFKKERPTLDQVKAMMIEIESRGKDAAGIGYLNKNKEVVVIKKAVPATNFVRTKMFRGLKESMPRIMICHTRFMTKGEPTNEKNNHPIFIPTAAMVHNGQIHNDDDVFDDLSMPRQAEVDSEVLLRIFEKYKYDFKKALPAITDNCGGSAAIAVIHSEWGEKLMLARSNNPISLLFDKERSILFFGSTDDTVEKGVPEPVKDKWYNFNLPPPFPPIYELNRDYGILIGPDGVEENCTFNMPTWANQSKWKKTTVANFGRGYGWKDTSRDRKEAAKQAQLDYTHSGGYTNSRGCWVNGKFQQITLREFAKRNQIGLMWEKFNNGVRNSSTCGWCGLLKQTKQIPTHPESRNTWMCQNCFVDDIIKRQQLEKIKALPDENPESYIECERCETKEFKFKDMHDWGINELICPDCFEGFRQIECCMCTCEVNENENHSKALVSAPGEPDEFMCLDCWMETYNNRA